MTWQPLGLINTEGNTVVIPADTDVSKLPSGNVDERFLERHDLLDDGHLESRRDIVQSRRVVTSTSSGLRSAYTPAAVVAGATYTRRGDSDLDVRAANIKQCCQRKTTPTDNLWSV